MIIDLAECKRLIRETSSDYDAEIETLIPIAQDDLCDTLQNWFQDDLITYNISEVSFVKGDPDTITDGQSEFVAKRFAAGMDIVIEGAHANTGIWELATVAAGTLTLTSSNELVSMAYTDDEYQPGWCKISKINWPRPLKVVVARMVQHLIIRNEPTGELSESIDGAVMTYDRRTTYPREIWQMAAKYRRASFV